VTWITSAPSIASVDQTGKVTALLAGSATITVRTVDSGFTATCAVTVTPARIPVTGVTVSPISITMPMGTKQNLTADVLPANATEKSVTWSSSSTTVATVSGTGEVSALAIGTATITVTTVDGNLNATCAVIVVPIVVSPDYPSDIADVVADTGIAAGDLEVKDNKVYLKKSAADAIAKDVLNVKAVDTNVKPVFTADVTPAGGVVQVTFAVTGKELLALAPEDINLIGMTTGSTGDLFDYVNSLSQLDAGKFTLLLGGAVFLGEIDPDGIYELVVCIEDGGKFDLDGTANGKVVSEIFFAAEKAKSGGGGGCSTYGYLAFALLAVPFVFRKRK
jgi:Synergist-CTERM protein sorting domain-containing protein